MAERIGDEPPVMKRLQHGLVNHAAQRDQVVLLDLVGIFLRLFQAERGPINRVRLRQTPVERALFLVHFLREHGINLVFFTEHERVGFFFGGLRMDQI